MKGIKRLFIDLNEDKIRNKYNIPKIKEHDLLWCINNKWSIFSNDREQGFDSDCFLHCWNYEKCEQIFNDEECYGKNNFKLIILPIDKEPHWTDKNKEVEIIEKLKGNRKQI